MMPSLLSKGQELTSLWKGKHIWEQPWVRDPLLPAMSRRRSLVGSGRWNSCPLLHHMLTLPSHMVSQVSGHILQELPLISVTF